MENGKRVLKLLRYGNDDVITPRPVMPFGIDSVPAPVKNLIGVYADTARDGNMVLIGYIPAEQVAQVGELRLYSMNEEGNAVAFQQLLKNDGTCELGGTTDNLVRYTALDAGMQSTVTQVLTNLNQIAVAINAIVPGSYTPSALGVDISAAKINEIKTS